MQYGVRDGQLIVIEERRVSACYMRLLLASFIDSPFQAIKGMEWIEQLFFTDRPEGLLVSGFHSVSGV